MRTIIDFSHDDLFIELTDEEYAEWEKRNAKEIERRRVRQMHDEAQAIGNAERRGEARGEERANIKWQAIIAEKDKQLAELDAEIAKADTRIAELLVQLGETQ